MTAPLEVRGVCGGYGRVQVLRDVDLEVPSGAAVALLGPNGAGKTTLLRTICGLLPATAGQVLVQGQDVTRRRAAERAARGLCLVPEGRGVFRRLTVWENLAVHAGRRNMPDALDRIREVFPVLCERLDQAAGTLSGGQQQMLAVSRAVLSDAPVVLADELSLGLAPVVVDEIVGVLERLKAEGRSLLVVEQYVERALGLADHVHLLHRGRVVLSGTPEECRDAEVFSRYLEGAR